MLVTPPSLHCRIGLVRTKPDWLGSLILRTFLPRIVLPCDPQILEDRIPTAHRLQMARLGEMSGKLLMKLFE